MTAYEEHLVNNGWSPEEAAVMYQRFSDPNFSRDPIMMREYQPGFLSRPTRAQLGTIRPTQLADSYVQSLVQTKPQSAVPVTRAKVPSKNVNTQWRSKPSYRSAAKPARSQMTLGQAIASLNSPTPTVVTPGSGGKAPIIPFETPSVVTEDTVPTLTVRPNTAFSLPTDTFVREDPYLEAALPASSQQTQVTVPVREVGPVNYQIPSSLKAYIDNVPTQQSAAQSEKIEYDPDRSYDPGLDSYMTWDGSIHPELAGIYGQQELAERKKAEAEHNDNVARALEVLDFYNNTGDMADAAEIQEAFESLNPEALKEATEGRKTSAGLVLDWLIGKGAFSTAKKAYQGYKELKTMSKALDARKVLKANQAESVKRATKISRTHKIKQLQQQVTDYTAAINKDPLVQGSAMLGRITKGGADAKIAYRALMQSNAPSSMKTAAQAAVKGQKFIKKGTQEIKNAKETVMRPVNRVKEAYQNFRNPQPIPANPAPAPSPTLPPTSPAPTLQQRYMDAVREAFRDANWLW